MITGFPTETEQDHQDTLSLMEYVKYNFGYMYSTLNAQNTGGKKDG
jgi:tRNA-2-methylthio-N6-dimethylallyladenosine synthase